MKRPGPRYPTVLEYEVHRGMIRRRAAELAELPIIVGSPRYDELLELSLEFTALGMELERFGPQVRTG